MHNIINSFVSIGWGRDTGSTSLQNRMNGIYMGRGGEKRKHFGTINLKQKKGLK